MRKNRKFSAEFKLQCVKEVLEEYKSHKEVCRKYQLDAIRFFKLQHFLKNATLNEKCNTPILETKNAKSTDNSLIGIVCALFFYRIKLHYN